MRFKLARCDASIKLLLLNVNGWLFYTFKLAHFLQVSRFIDFYFNQYAKNTETSVIFTIVVNPKLFVTDPNPDPSFPRFRIRNQTRL
jgi:hypothetical protein